MERLHLVITGHVDHGKSTLIGRLLFETGSLPPERLSEVKAACEREGRPLEFAFIMDHLQEERARGITIDTSQYCFHAGDREVVIIDAPGHKQFLKNTLTGASQADAAVLVVDVVEGLREQTRRHAYLLRLLGIDQVVAVVNKMDLVEWREEPYRQARRDLDALATELGFTVSDIIPVSAAAGDGIKEFPQAASWYRGATLLDAIALLSARAGSSMLAGVMPVQDVYVRQGRQVAVGTVSCGRLAPGEDVQVCPEEGQQQVEAIWAFPGKKAEALEGESIGVLLKGDPRITRGQVLSAGDAGLKCTDRLDATLFWMGPGELANCSNLRLECATQSFQLRALEVLRRYDSASLENLDAAQEIEPSEVAEVRITTDSVGVFSRPGQVRELGRFVLARGDLVVAGGIITAFPGEE